MMQMMTRTAIHPLKIAAAVGAAFLVWGLVLAYASSPAQARTITVNSTADPGADDALCTLREAITSANTDAASGGAWLAPAPIRSRSMSRPEHDLA